MFFQDYVPSPEFAPQVVMIVSPSLCAMMVSHCFPDPKRSLSTFLSSVFSNLLLCVGCCKPSDLNELLSAFTSLTNKLACASCNSRLVV